jgi:hypothetical protein
MGKLLIFVSIILVTVILLGLWGYFLQTRQTANTMGLKGSKKQIATLQAGNTRYVNALKEIREIAEASEVTQGDPLWSMIVTKIDEALLKENKK